MSEIPTEAEVEAAQAEVAAESAVEATTGDFIQDALDRLYASALLDVAADLEALAAKVRQRTSPEVQSATRVVGLITGTLANLNLQGLITTAHEASAWRKRNQ